MKYRGFTLIEILVALTMFALIGGSLLQLFGQGLRTARRAEDRVHAVLLARSKLTELQVFPFLQPGVLSGQFADGFRWQVTLRLHDAPARHDILMQPLDTDILVSWGDGADTQSFLLRTLLLTRWGQS